MRRGKLYSAWRLITAGTVLWGCAAVFAQPAGQTQETTTHTADRFEVGQRWDYEHRGPRPGALEPVPIDGQRILQVVSRAEQEGQSVWVLEERFTEDPNVVGHLHVDDGGMLRSLDLVNEKGEVTRLRYESAIAFQTPALEVGEQRTVTTTLRSADGKLTMPMTLGWRRLADEVVESPSGRYEKCRHVEVVTASSIDLKLAKIPLRETRQRWYSDAVHGLVKEVYRREPGKFLTWSWEGYTATSTLAHFGVEAVAAEATPVITEPAQRETTHSRGRPRPILLGIAVLAAVCVTLGVLFLKRR